MTLTIENLPGSSFGSSLPQAPIYVETPGISLVEQPRADWMIWYLCAALMVCLIAVFVALSISIGG